MVHICVKNSNLRGVKVCFNSKMTSTWFHLP